MKPISMKRTVLALVLCHAVCALYIENIKNNDSVKTRILSVLKSLSLPSESIRLVDKIWIVDSPIR